MSALKLCPTCGSEYPANERFCPRDGTALRSQDGGNDLVGSIIAERYHVIKKLGEGGMGQVYLAEHVKMGRKSAVKVMNPGMVNDSDAISRFNREASNASRINHPNVAGIYDFGETPDGIIYLAMEFIEGESLTAIVEASGALPAIRAARIVKQAADGLTQAHDLGIVHRDLKPDNIMIAKNRDGSDCVKVVDFGIAKAAGSESQKVTRTGMVIGTPEYMSPEQLAGDKLDPKSDIYSLALVAFNMLTGTLPFPSETVQESMIMRLTDKPKRLAEMNASVAWPATVQAVMDRALERDAKLRYQHASQFGNALLEAIESMPKNATATDGTMVLDASALPMTRVAPSPAGEPAAPAPATAAPPAANRTPMLAGGGLLAAAAIGGIWFATRSSTPAASAPAPVATAPVAQTSPPAAGTTPPVAPPNATASLSNTGVPASQGSTPLHQAAGHPATQPAARDKEKDAKPAVTGASIASQLKVLDRQAEGDGTATQAISGADALLPKVTTVQDRVYLSVIKAQAYGTLGEDGKACTELRNILPTAKGTSYEKNVNVMLQRGQCP